MDPESQPSLLRPAAGPTATESTPLLPRPESDDDASRPVTVPQWVIISHWITAIDGLLVVALCFAIVVIDSFFRPRIYAMPWAIMYGLLSNILVVGRPFPAHTYSIE